MATVLLIPVQVMGIHGAQPAQASSVTTSFGFNSNNQQSWTAPSAGRVSITVRGGRGQSPLPKTANNPTASAGRGAEITVSRAVAASEAFSILISGAGSSGSGDCLTANARGGYYAAIWKTPGVNDAVVAGGGGGAGCNAANASTSRVPGAGGDAGLPGSADDTAPGVAGGNGVDAADGSTDDVLGGGGGGTSAGGAGGTGSNGGPAPTINGAPGGGPTAFVPGGLGGNGAQGAGAGGGGGGGRYGGGAGGSTGFGQGAGGGGGSSYVGASWTFGSAQYETVSDAPIIIVFTPAATVTSLSPTSGPSAGGTSVTITGTNLDGVSAVTVGGAAATNIGSNTSTSVTFTTPAGTPGARDVVVTTGGGNTTAVGAFTYTAPAQGCVDPDPFPYSNGAYELDDSTDLLALRSDSMLWRQTCSFRLLNDIDMGGVTWTSTIGDANDSFLAQFDGAGFTISNLTIDRRGLGDYAGLFGIVNHPGSVVNLGFDGVVHGNVLFTGGLVGYNDGRIERVFTSGLVTANSAALPNGRFVGGLIGCNSPVVGDGSGYVIRSFSTASVSASSADEVGGLIGSNFGVVSRSYATGQVAGRDKVGGLVGTNFANPFSPGDISNSYATGSVAGRDNVGGFVGNNDRCCSADPASTISNSYTLGNVTATGPAGAFAGYNAPAGGPSDPASVIRGSFSTGTVNGGSGNFVGNGSGAIGPRTVTQMQSLATFTTAPANWSIGEGWRPSSANVTWGICSPADATVNSGAPFLNWQFANAGVAPCVAPASFTVTLNAQGGSGVPSSLTYTGAALTLPSPSRSGYSFNGWFTALSGGTQITSPYTPSADVTIFAQWTPLTPDPGTPPSAPWSVVGVAGDGSVGVSWDVPVDAGSFPITDYEAAASPGGQSCVVKAPALSCTISGLSNGTAYTFEVRALNGAGWGPWSVASDPVTPKRFITVPGPVRDLKVVKVTSAGVVKLRWLPPASDGGAPVEAYQVRVRRVGTEKYVRVLPDVVQTRATVSGLRPGQRYWLRVRAVNEAGPGLGSVTSQRVLIPLN